MSLAKHKIALDLPDKGTIEKDFPKKAGDYAEFSTPETFYKPVQNQGYPPQQSEDGFLSMNPVLVNSQSGTMTMRINVGLSNLSCDANCDGNIVKWSFQDVIQSIPDGDLRNEVKKFNSQFAVPKSLKVLGTSLGEFENYFALQVFDNSTPLRPLHTVTGFKVNSSDQVYGSGYPLYLLKHGQNSVLLKSGTFNSEHLAYWSLNMDMLEHDVSLLHMPGKNTENVLIRKDSQAANMANYALSVKNSMVMPPLLENPAYTYAVDQDFIIMPKNLFSDVKEAYKNKFEEVKQGSYDLSSIFFKLVPLPGVAKEKLEMIDNAYVSLEIVAHMGVDGSNSSNYNSPPEHMSNGLFETRPGVDMMDEL